MDITSLLGGLIGGGLIGGVSAYFIQNGKLEGVQNKLEQARSAQAESENLKQQQDTEIQQAELGYQREIQTLQQQVKELQQRPQIQPQTTNAFYAEADSTVESSYKARLQEERERHQNEIQGLQRSYEDQIRELKRDYQAQMLELTQLDSQTDDYKEVAPVSQSDKETYIPGLKTALVAPISEPVEVEQLVSPSFDLSEEIPLHRASETTLEEFPVQNLQEYTPFSHPSIDDLSGLDEFIADDYTLSEPAAALVEDFTTSVDESPFEENIGLDEFIAVEDFTTDLDDFVVDEYTLSEPVAVEDVISAEEAFFEENIGLDEFIVVEDFTTDLDEVVADEYTPSEPVAEEEEVVVEDFTPTIDEPSITFEENIGLDEFILAEDLSMGLDDFVADEYTSSEPVEEDVISAEEEDNITFEENIGLDEFILAEDLSTGLDDFAAEQYVPSEKTVEGVFGLDEFLSSEVNIGLDEFIAADEYSPSHPATADDIFGLDDFLGGQDDINLDEFIAADEYSLEAQAETVEDLFGLDDFLGGGTTIETYSEEEQLASNSEELVERPLTQELTNIQSETDPFDFDSFTISPATTEELVEEERTLEFYVSDDSDLLESFSFEQPEISSLDELHNPEGIIDDLDNLDFLEMPSLESPPTGSDELDFFDILNASESPSLAEEQSVVVDQNLFPSAQRATTDLDFAEMLGNSDISTSTAKTNSQDEILDAFVVDMFLETNEFDNDFDLSDLSDLLDDSAAGESSIDELSEAFPDLFGQEEAPKTPDHDSKSNHK